MAKMVIKMISETEAQVTKAFAKNAVIFGTEEYKLWRESEEYGTAEYELLKNILADFPTMTIIVKSGREKKTASKFKNLTYEKMRTYINVLDNADEMNAVMDTIEAQSKSQKSPYNFVYTKRMEVIKASYERTVVLLACLFFAFLCRYFRQSFFAFRAKSLVIWNKNRSC